MNSNGFLAGKYKKGQAFPHACLDKFRAIWPKLIRMKTMYRGKFSYSGMNPSKTTLPNWSPKFNGCEHDVWNFIVCRVLPPKSKMCTKVLLSVFYLLHYNLN